MLYIYKGQGTLAGVGAVKAGDIALLDASDARSREVLVSTASGEAVDPIPLMLSAARGSSPSAAHSLTEGREGSRWVHCCSRGGS